jgi:methionyl-tRNA synthetase
MPWTRPEEQAADVQRVVEQAKLDFEREFDDYNLSRAIEAAQGAIARVDKFISDLKPWNLAKDPAREADLVPVLGTAVRTLRQLTVLLVPVLPESTRPSGSSLVRPAIWHPRAGQSRLAGIEGTAGRRSQTQFSTNWIGR